MDFLCYAVCIARRGLISSSCAQLVKEETEMTATRCKRLLALFLAAVMLMSLLCVSAAAAGTGLDEAKKDLPAVTLTQTYGTKHGGNPANGAVTHDIRTSGRDVYITYAAKLTMGSVMAAYLQPRQKQLYDASFNVNMNVDLEWLEFVDGSTLKFTFQSTFLKPVQPGGASGSDYSFALTGYDAESKYFTYTITVSKDWVQKTWPTGKISVPMELIVWTDWEKTAQGFSEAKTEHPDAVVMFADYTLADWEKPITLTLADMKVKTAKVDSIPVGGEYTVRASGTVDGQFSYIKLHEPQNISDAGKLAGTYSNTLDFGDGKDITEWESNEVWVKLTYSKNVPVVPNPTPTPGGNTEPSDLNITDHFAYVIGYPDGTVRPERQITRAEVATIFFRMLKDEARNKYWATTNEYTDVKKTDWYNNAVSTLSNMGIINGYPDGSFHPNANITRAEFAKIAVSFFKDYVSETIGDRFTDISGKWYTTYINLAAELNIVSGYPDGTFLPEKQITRAEAMQIVNNTLRRTPHKDRLLPESGMNTWPDNSRKNIWYYAAVQEATNSHEYARSSFTDYETWQAKLPERDWAAFERAWSDANAAPNPGEVVDGSNSYLDRN